MERFLADASVPEGLSSILAELTGSTPETVIVDGYENVLARIRKDIFTAVAVTYAAGCESVIKRIRVTSPRAKILVFGVSETKTAARLMSLGVAFCFSRSTSPEQLRKHIARVIIDQTTGIELATRKQQWLVGESSAVQELRQNLKEVVQETRNILINGEPGTGRAQVARVIHECGHTRHLQFKTISLSMFDQQYLCSQFWSTFANNFSDIDSTVEGIRQPIYGTIYLEGLETQPLDFVMSLLEMIRSHQDRIHADDTAGLAPRVLIAWSRADREVLHRLMDQSQYIQLNVPTLMSRREDIPILIHTMVNSFASKHNKPVNSLSLSAFNYLINYPWPGNIQEMQCIIESAVLSCDNRTIDIEDIGLTAQMIIKAWHRNITDAHLTLRQSVQLFQKELILAVLKTSGFSMQKASQFLGLNKSQLFNKMKMLGIPLDTW